MKANVSQFGQRQRQGFTLMEMLLVLALLVVISAISLPALQGPMENHRLRVSGDILRVQWSHARIKAMETGRTYVFKFQPELQSFKIEPWYLEDDYLESSDLIQGAAGGALAGANGNLPNDFQANGASSPGGIYSPNSTTATSTMDLGELPENVMFVGSETELDDRSAYLSLTTPSEDVDVVWSDPIFFYPDGTSSTARILIRNSRARYLMVSVRGLTGVVQVSDLLTVEEIQ
ncbi:MAG: prepilin-type N-terminal cleavage/methylation domain-containing protein [Pirellulaceae bacterium]|nr:prepilin-type N-terminal cleavage/methylation domain-containing protein [Pirellulaceae bacterium]MDP6722765.1 prepilin-type N-terminal cleavage/methylation domain-containing protein [Pirellulaceae bacterium]